MNRDDEIWEDYMDRLESDLFEALVEAGETPVQGWYAESTVKRYLPWYSGAGIHLSRGAAGGLRESVVMR